MTETSTKSMTDPQTERSSLVQSVERALILLDALADQQSGLTLTELCERVGFHASTAHRLLATLSEHDYVRQDSRSKAYRLGFRLIRVGQAARDQLDLRDEVMQDLEALAREVQELANLVIPIGHEVTYIAQSNGRKGQGGIQMFTQLGARVPMYCTAVGKSILAFLPEEEMNKILEEESLIAHTPYTITNVFQLREDLEKVRQNGYAFDNEEREIGVRCVASPVWDGTNRVIAAVGVSGPSGRVTSELCEEYAPTVLATAQYISQQLGYKGDFNLYDTENG